MNAQPAQPGGPPLSPPAGPSNCADFRQKIIAMEAPGEIRPPGWFQLDLYLRQLYQTDCIDHPTRQPPKEYWYRADGTSTGVPADDKHGRPTDGAYTTTQEIGDYCLKQAGTLIPESRGTGKVRAGLSPSICAMAGNLRQACAQPVDDQERRQCATILGDTKASLPPPGAALPPMQVGLDGGPYTLTSTCSALLGRLSGDPNADQAPAEEKGRWLQILNNECPDFLAALERRVGATPGKDPSTFWPAVAGLILNGFPPPGGRNLSTADINADPGFQRMCGEARTNQQKCVDRFNNIASFGSNPGSIAQASGDSQRGAFAECARLYGNVLQMCQATGSVAPRVLARLQPPPPPKPAPPPQPAKPSGGDSRPPPQQPQMSAQCQQLVSNYVAAAQAHDGPRALAGYNALKGAGGCGVLAKVDRPMPQPQAAPADDPRFVARGATPLSDQVVGGCDAAPAECQRRVQQLRAGVSPEAQAAIFMNAVSIGLQLGATMASGMAATMPQGGGGTNMNSIGNRPVQHTYGQGAPAYRAPRNSPSDITGTK
ncbi:MAG: hypothetical protein JSS04_09260 [Proteobacteria bacterium]|nr:hypothetical protein [Pseudomonadota bacterium]